jgi:hypothetical protein
MLKIIDVWFNKFIGNEFKKTGYSKIFRKCSFHIKIQSIEIVKPDTTSFSMEPWNNKDYKVLA